MQLGHIYFIIFSCVYIDIETCILLKALLALTTWWWGAATLLVRMHFSHASRYKQRRTSYFVLSHISSSASISVVWSTLRYYRGLCNAWQHSLLPDLFATSVDDETPPCNIPSR
jgi:hypothetical protein